jgi:bifunctional non-homologous end joining protein LigD
LRLIVIGRQTSATGAETILMATRKRNSSATGKAKPLSEYNRKRDFTRTAEPSGRMGKAPAKRALHFVVQKHAASHLHYDFRLELDGVMKSWAVPKGPSYDPGVRRLAMEVEDHPIEYNTFEGTIPKGQYGGGTVMLWDRGTYEAEDGGGIESLRDGYERGDLKIVLHGKRLQGGWVLVRMRRDDSERAQWLLIKHRDETADPAFDVTDEVTTSVASGRTMEQIATRNGRVWNSDRDDTPKKRTTAASRKKATTKRTAKRAGAKSARKAVRKTARKPAAKKAPSPRGRKTTKAR